MADAIISDGVTDINIGGADETPERVLERNSKVSAGGSLKQQVAGSRLVFNVECSITGAVNNSIYTLLTNGAQFYFYSPTDTHSMFPDVVFPLAVEYSDFKRRYDNRRKYYLSFTVTSVDYIEC